MDFLWNLLVAFAVLFGFGWLLSEIQARIPRKEFNRVIEPWGCKEFSANIRVDKYAVEEFRFCFVEEWECGFEFYAEGHGPITFRTHDEATADADEWAGLSYVEVTKREEEEAKPRSTFKFYPDEGALEKDTIIGWARISESVRLGRTSEVRIFMLSTSIKMLLDELRNGDPQLMYASGFEDEKGRIRINSFSMMPAD